VRRPRLPGSFWTIDDYAVEVAKDWSASETANLGFDQFRGNISPRSARALPWTVGPGSVVRGITDDGTVLWEGEISAPITIETDDWVGIEAQGFVYESSKLADRFPLKVVAPEAWVVGNSSPLNMPQVATDQPEVTYDKSSVFYPTAQMTRNNRVLLSGTAMSDGSVVFWARGSRISRFSAGLQSPSGSGIVEVFGAIGPDLLGSLRRLYVTAETVQQYVSLDIPKASGFDALVIRYSGAGTSTLQVREPRIWCETSASVIRAQDVFRGIGEHMGWDVSGVQDVGVAAFPTFDWGAAAIGALSEAAAPDDLVWQVRERYGDKSRLELREWGEREYVVSGATGARWRLNRMERYSRVTAQYLDEVGAVKTVTVDADPNPLGRGQIKELLVTLGGLVPIDVTTNTAETLANTVLSAVSSQRFRGDIDTTAVYLNGVFATYDSRAGDVVTVTDWSKIDGAFTDRIAKVTKGAEGAVLTLEPSVLAGSASRTSSSGTTPGTLLRVTVIPQAIPGGPGTTTPQTGVNPPYDPTVGDILF